jgi:hypothetical protein
MLVADLPASDAIPRWSLPTRVAYRFFFAYFAVYFATSMVGALIVLPVGGVPELLTTGAGQAVISWVASHVFHVAGPLVVTGSGSGDKTFDWVHAFCVLTIAVLATAIWSALDRRRANYGTLDKWFRLIARFVLGSTLVIYGMDKAIPLQMPYPGLMRLVEPYGNFSLMGVLWAFVGASPAYEVLTGLAELTGGILLFVPQTATLGALICLADTIQIFSLNMTYDVPVKLFSFHLLVLSALLLAPDARRLVNVLILNRTAYPSTRPTLGRTPRRAMIWTVAQVIFGLYLVGANLYGARQAWTQFGGGAPKSALYGIWNVDVMTIDGVTRSALVTDFDRWRRVIFDRPTMMAFQRMNDSITVFGAAIDTAAKTIVLTRSNDPKWKTQLSFDRPAAGRLILTGAIDGEAIRMELSLLDRNGFLLVTRGFHWVQEYPFNR